MQVNSTVLAFVVAARLLSAGAVTVAAKVFTAPARALDTVFSDSDSELIEWWTDVRASIAAVALSRIPSWMEHRSGWKFIIETSYASQHLDRLATSVPQRVFELWRRFGIRVMELFQVVWGALLLAAVGAGCWATIIISERLLAWAMQFDWLSLFEPPARQPRLDPYTVFVDAIATIPELLITLAIAVVLAVALTVICWLAFLPLMPGLILHEFGHYAPTRRAGGTVESYGLLLIGPIPGGAFVKTGEDVALLDTEDTIGIMAGGIANTTLWGIALIAGGLIMGGNPIAVVDTLIEGSGNILLSSSAGVLLVLLGYLELLNGFLNAFPSGPVDGGHFIQQAQQDWWGFNSALAQVDVS